MIGDRRLYKKSHYKKADIILKMIKYLSKKKLLILISGSSGTGKTEVSDILQEKVWNIQKKRVKIIHIDDYYLTNWNDRNKLRKQKGLNSVGIEEIDWRRLFLVLDTFLSRKKKLYVQRIHKYTNSIEYSICNNRNIDILIIEGLYSLYLKKYYEKSFGVFLEGTTIETYNFRKERLKENPDSKFRKKVLVKEYKDVLKLKKYSNIVITYNGEKQS